MQESVVVCCGVRLRYYIHGTDPRLFVHVGTHGDEWGVVASVEACALTHTEQIRDCIIVLGVSPSAGRLGTRNNAAGHDVNRMFTDAACDMEVRANQTLMYNRAFDLFLSFHEDTDRTNEWYLYDTDDAPDDAGIRNLFARAAEVGVTPYSGPDGTTDGAVVIRDGYFSEQWDGGGFTREALAGQAPIYAVRKGIAKRAITLEIPGLAPQKVKNELVAVIFNHFIANAKQDE